MEYLEEMKRKENPNYKSDSFHIGPISGLIMSEFVRMQQEYKTAVDLWLPAHFTGYSCNKKKNQVLLLL